MCLGTVGQVIATTGSTAVVTAGGRQLTAALLTVTDEVRVGDWVLVHSGLALARLTDQEAAEALRLRTPRDEVTS